MFAGYRSDAQVFQIAFQQFSASAPEPEPSRLSPPAGLRLELEGPTPVSAEPPNLEEKFLFTITRKILPGKKLLYHNF